MKSSVFNQKELSTGVLYVLFGAVAVGLGQDYGFGSTTDMGAGFFPIILGCILFVIGAITLIRAWGMEDDGQPGPLRTIYWKGLALIVGGIVLFAWLLPVLGLAIVLPVMLTLSALASARFELNVKSIALLIAFCVLCILLFIEGLGVPMPLFGTIFG